MSTPESLPTTDFYGQITAITGRVLTPENIDTYAHEALEDLVGVVQNATEQYSLAPTIQHDRGIRQERAALSYFGLDENGVEATLDHIAEQAEEIRGLDALIERRTVFIDRVITPPDTREAYSTEGGKRVGPKRHIPRLKTLLFAAHHALNVDLKNPEECDIVAGKVDPDMVRNESYKLVILPALNRAVLVCDEEENATFVFDTDMLTAANVAQNDLIGMGKDALKTLLSLHPQAGYRLKYTNRFTENVVSLLKTIPAPNNDVPLDPEGGRLLQATIKAPKGYFTTGDIAKEFDTTYDLTSQAVVTLADELGEVPTYTFVNGNSGPIFTEEQKAAIHGWLKTNGYLVPKSSPEDDTLHTMARALKVGQAVLAQAVAALGDKLGSPTRKRVKNGYTDTYSAAQRDRVRTWLVENHKIPKDPNIQLLSADKLTPFTGLSNTTLRKILANHADRLGVERINSRNYLPEPQIAALRSLLEELGYTVPDLSP